MLIRNRFLPTPHFHPKSGNYFTISLFMTKASLIHHRKLVKWVYIYLCVYVSMCYGYIFIRASLTQCNVCAHISLLKNYKVLLPFPSPI